MFKKRNVAAPAVAAVLAVTMLSGCGRSAEPSVEAAAEALSSGPATGTVTVWAQGAEGEALPELAKDFEAENPDVTIKVTAIPWDAALNKYQTSIAAGSTPDVAQMGTTWMADFSGAFDPTPAEIDTSGFFPGALEAASKDGVAYGVPWYVDTRVVFYRTDVAAAAGFTDAPQTWDDFKALAKAMQTEAGAEYGVRLPPGGPGSFQDALTFTWSNGAELMNDDDSEWTFEDDAWADAFTFYQSFFTEGIANANPPTGAGAVESAFVDGSVPMFIGGPWMIGALSEAGGDGFEDKYAVARVPSEKSSTSFVGGSVLTVFKESENRDAAWKFVQWLSEPEVQAKWQEMTGDLPAVQDAWKADALADDPKLAVFGEQLDDAKSPPSVTTWTQVSAAADRLLEQIVKEGKDPREALADLQSQADSLGAGD